MIEVISSALTRKILPCLDFHGSIENRISSSISYLLLKIQRHIYCRYMFSLETKKAILDFMVTDKKKSNYSDLNSFNISKIYQPCLLAGLQ